MFSRRNKAARNSALSNDCIGSVGRMDATQAPRDLAEPLAAVQLALRSPGEAKARFPSYRLSRLVASRLQLDDLDMESFSKILKLDPVNPSIEQRRPFDYQLRHVIWRYKLQSLLAMTALDHIITRSGLPATTSAPTRSFRPTWKDGGPTIAEWRTIARCSPPRSFGSIEAEKIIVGCAAFPVPGTWSMHFMT